MNPRFLLLGLLGSLSLLGAEPQVLIDAVPTAAGFAGVNPIRLPFEHAATEDPKEIEAGLNQAITGLLPAVARAGFSFVCLLSAPGDEPVSIPIASAKQSLKLSRQKTSVQALFFQGGHPPAGAIAYAEGKPESEPGQISVRVQKIAVPQGVTTAGWVYFNLSRIQAEAEKAGASKVWLAVEGEGPLMPVPIPGMKTSLLVPDGKPTLTATWTGTKGKDPAPGDTVLGHPIAPPVRPSP